jgi:hypothetical protein
MAFNFKDLDQQTRHFMVEEVDHDIAGNRLYRSNRLTEEGWRAWPELLKEAVRGHDEVWLAQVLAEKRVLKAEEQRVVKGKTITAKVPVTAPSTLAEGEFNRLYVRGLCRRAMEERIPEVFAYRARASGQPREDSERLIGRAFDPTKLLEDLRNSQGVDTALGLPPGPNSGLSASLRR